MCGSEEADAILKEIHEGFYGNNLGGQALTRKVILADYFWPTVHQDLVRLVKTYRARQIHSNMLERPVELMKAMISSYPFDQWGIDIVGPMPMAPLQKKFLVVAMDYFSKWVEAEPLGRITEGAMIQFL